MFATLRQIPFRRQPCFLRHPHAALFLSTASVPLRNARRTPKDPATPQKPRRNLKDAFDPVRNASGGLGREGNADELRL
jgi:hypothetical protein